jgi:hypothetical protein
MFRVNVSIYGLPPLETGGVQNRKGIAFQDHIALGFCLRVLDDARLIEVWCETQDDITLIWRINGNGLLAEFVQAKSNELDKLWSISDLCAREKGKEGTSIVERSLAYDRCAEETRFRIVTARPFRAELRPMTLRFGCAGRRAAAGELGKLQTEFAGKVGSYKSPNGATCREWVERTRLDVRHGEQAVHDANAQRLRRLLEVRGFNALHDQVEQIYSALLVEVFKAGRADPAHNMQDKRFSKKRVEALLRKLAEIHLRYPLPSGGEVMEEKLAAANLPPDTIAHAQEQRRTYRFRSLQPKYQTTQNELNVEREVGAILHSLKCDLDMGQIHDDGRQFHAICLKALNDFRAGFPAGRQPSLADLYGCMYVMTDRCFHRFRRLNL